MIKKEKETNMKRLTKRLTALAIAFVITMLSMPITAQAACNHQPNVDVDGNVLLYITDTQHYKICTDCCESYDIGFHTNNGSDECTVCEVTLDAGTSKHTHVTTNGVYGFKDKFGHTLVCSDTKCIGEFQTHTNCVVGDRNGDGTWDCDYCGWDGIIVGKGCVHDFAGSIWYADPTEHYAECTICSNEVFSNHEDDDNNGFCDDCGASVVFDSTDNIYIHHHTGSNATQKDADHHFSTCTACGRVYNEAHFDDDNDGDCDACGYVCPHNGFQWYDTVENTHQLCCGMCGNNILPVENHEDLNGDNLCDVCGVGTVNNIHTHVWSNQWSFSDQHHFYDCTDKACTRSTGAEGHDDMANGDGICDKCGYGTPFNPGGSNQGGSNQGGCQHNSVWYAIDEEIHEMNCMDCNTSFNGELHVDNMNNSTHSQGSDGFCDGCGTAVAYDVNDGKYRHAHDFNPNWDTNPGGHYHECLDNACTAGDGFANHEDNVDNTNTSNQTPDGLCDICDAAMCTHSSGRIDGYEIGPEGHKPICRDCGQTMIPFNQGPEFHKDADSNARCDVCDATVALNNGNLEHTHEPDQWMVDGPEHTAPCKGCSYLTFREGHVDQDGNGNCDLCQANMGGGNQGGQPCTHDRFWIAIEKYTHQAICGDCGQPCGPQDPHMESDGDGRCDNCGAPVVDENGDLVHNHNMHPHGWYGEKYEHFYRCDTCGMTSYNFEKHVDSDSNGKCDICKVSLNANLEHHCPTLIWKAMDEMNHAEFCEECYREFGYCNHVDNDNDDACDDCLATLDGNDMHIHQTNGSWTEDGRDEHCSKCTECEGWAYEPHEDNDGDGYCDICKGDLICKHTGYQWYGTAEDSHELHCGDCGESISNPEAHHDTDGDTKCDVCGVGVVNNIHTHVWSTTWESGTTGHWQSCTDIACTTSEGSYAHEDADNDGSCDACGNTDKLPWCPGHWHNGDYVRTADYHYTVCGDCCNAYGAGIAHNGADGYRIEADKHYPVCVDCWMSYDPGIAHADTNGDGYCDDCMITVGANGIHSHTVNGWTVDVQVHTKTCDECGNEVAGAAQTHTDDGNGKCSVCKASLDANNEHYHQEVYDNPNNMTHFVICDDCGTLFYGEEHIDEDGDKVCDLCNHAFVTADVELAAGVRASVAARVEAAVIKAATTGDYNDMKAIFDAPDHVLQMFVDAYEYALREDPGAYFDALVITEAVVESDCSVNPDLQPVFDNAKVVVKDSVMSRIFAMDIIGSLEYSDGTNFGATANYLNGTEDFDFVLKLDAKDVKSNRTWYVVVSDDEGATFTKIAESAKGASEITFTHDSYYSYYALVYKDEVTQNPSDDSGSSDSGSSDSGSDNTEAVVPSETPTPTPAPTQTPTSAPTSAPTSTPTSVPTQTPTPSASPQATEQPVEMPKEADTTIADVVVKAEVMEAVKDNVTISSGVAVIDKEAVEAIVDVTDKDDTVVIPLKEAATEVVEKAEINTEALAVVAEAEKDVVIEFTDITIKLDAKAVNAITEQAQGENIEIRVVKAEAETLTADQQKKLKDMDTAIVISAQIFSDDEYIGKFKGGKATVMLPFEIEEGRDAEDYKVYYIDEKGNLKKVAAEYVDGNMVFTTAHFSEYAIVYEGEVVDDKTETAAKEEDTAFEDPVEVEQTFTMLPIVIIIVIVIIIIAMVVLVIKTKKQHK